MSSRIKSVLFVVVGLAGVVLPIAVWAQFAYLAEFLWPDSLYEFAQALSLVGFVLLFYQFVLSGRSRFVEEALGLDRLISTHRRLGIAALALILLHGVFITVFELAIGALSVTVGKAIGVVAAILLVITAATAILWKSLGWRYEQWKKIHYANYVVLPAGLIHALMLGSTVRRSDLMRYYLIGLTVLFGIVVISRVARYIAARKRPLRVTEVVPEAHDVTSIYFEGRKPEFKPGQFMMIRLEESGRYSEEHPYTISSSPTDETLRISAKASGDFSAGLRDVTAGARAVIEAPFGVFSYVSVPSDKLVFIAGGIGVTPFLSQLRHMRATGASREVRMIWGNKTQQDLSFADELAAAEREVPGFSVTHVLSHEEWEGEHGFIDAELIRRHVDQPAAWHYMVCGPPVMMKAVFAALKTLGVPSGQVHHERFALG